MIDVFGPLAVESVQFSGGITGEQLAALVQQVASQQQGHTEFISVPLHRDGTVWCIGQTGAYRGVRVVSTMDGTPFIRPSTTYLWAFVTSFDWPEKDEPRYKPTPLPWLTVPTVIEFAKALRTAFTAARMNGFPEYDDPVPSPWEHIRSA